jgi:hypothetical protein
MWPLPALASTVKARRQTAPPENPYRRMEKAASDLIIAGLNLFRDVRDAMLESMFFQVFGSAVALETGEEPETGQVSAISDPRDLPIVQDALAAIGTGGYPEAVALMGALIGRGVGRISLERLAMIDHFIRCDEVLSKIPSDEVRRIKAEQAVVAELEPERGLQSLPKLLSERKDRQRAIALLEDAAAAAEMTPEQLEMFERVQAVLATELPSRRAKWEGAKRELASAK